MSSEINIGAVAKRTGLSVKAIRFYEASGFVPAAGRSESGYRRYTEGEVRRLRLVHLMRQLGMPLAEIRPLVENALSQDCVEFGSDLLAAFDRQREEINKRIAELEALRTELDGLSRHVEHCECEPGQALADCCFCPILDEEGGDC
jgi:MerR family copper efflux transcriptional regulator